MILFWLVPLGAALAFSLLLMVWGRINGLVAWLLVINFVAFITYGYDKAIAGTGKLRIPEKVLLALAFLGGAVGAFIGMQVFHHKTKKNSFQISFWLLVGLEMVLAAMYFYFIPK